MNPPLTGRLVWQQTKSGRQMRVQFPTRKGGTSPPTPFKPEDLAPSLKTIPDEGLEVHLELDGGRPCRIRPVGQPWAGETPPAPPGGATLQSEGRDSPPSRVSRVQWKKRLLAEAEELAARLRTDPAELRKLVKVVAVTRDAAGLRALLSLEHPSRSGRTRGYWEDIQQKLAPVLDRHGRDIEALLTVLGWAARLAEKPLGGGPPGGRGGRGRPPSQKRRW